MTRKLFYPIYFLMMFTLAVGCGPKKATTEYEPIMVMAYAQRVNDFLVILDASGSMGEDGKLRAAKDFISRMNQSIPELRMGGALRTFGQLFPLFSRKTVLVYGLEPYTKEGFDAALKSAGGAGGDSPLTVAIDAGAQDLEASHGQIAVIIVSDGKEMDDSSLDAARKMVERYGDRICIYTVVVGDDPAGEELLNRIALASLCGFSVSAASIKTEKDMAAFVKEVFFQSRADADLDGVLDKKDRCPGTLRGARVDERGCWVINVRFDTGKWDIKEMYHEALSRAAEIIKRSPGSRVEVQGHTDNRGTAAYNTQLSQNRAREVMNYLIFRGVDLKQLTAKGYGYSKPAASNATRAGRAKNRRIEFKVLP